jgi:hypothetical protein
VVPFLILYPCMSTKIWNKDQIRIILKATLNRLIKEKDTFSIKDNGSDITLAQYGNKNKIYMSIKKNYSHVYMSLNDLNHFYSPSFLPWSDKEQKSLIRDIMSIISKQAPSPIQTLHDIFPEALTQEFETQILAPKD